MSDVYTLKNVTMTPEIGRALKNYRIAHDVSAKSITNKFGKASSYISKLEKGDIKKVESFFFINLCNFISDSTDGLGEFICFLSKYYRSCSLETRLSMINMDEFLYDHDISLFMEYISSYIRNHQIDKDELVKRINSNTDIIGTPGYKVLIENQWIALNDNKDKLVIKYNISRKYIDCISASCRIEERPRTIHRGIAEVVLSYLYVLGKETNAKTLIYKTLEACGIDQKRKTNTPKNTFSNVLEPDIVDNFNDFVHSLQTAILLTNDYGAKRLKQMCDNMNTDLSFCFAFMSEDLKSLSSKSKDTKQEFLNELRELIKKYAEVNDILDLYE
ncbi:MAG: hypothetical protein LIP10_12995 [Clostridiales bacterium]|nr:hypothetical protein [Clostridiales bacterium]